MSLKYRLITVLSVAGATALLATASFAQDSNSTTNPADKASAPQKTERGFGKRGFGEGKFGGRHGEMGMHRGRGMGMMLRGLDLTDAQKTQIQSIMAANKPTQEARDEMRTLMMAKRTGTLTTDQQSRLTAIRTGAEQKRTAVHEQILSVLTPEQKAKLDQRKQEMQQRMQERKQWRQQKQTGTAPTDKPTTN
jgi:protein CpxP